VSEGGKVEGVGKGFHGVYVGWRGLGFEIDAAAIWGDGDSRGFSRQTGSFVDLSGRNWALVKCKDVV